MYLPDHDSTRTGIEHTRSVEVRVYHTRQDPKCRLCRGAHETEQHITAACKMLAGKAYLERHNQGGGIVYRSICTEYGLEVPGSKWTTPPKVIENNQAKILCDIQIRWWWPIDQISFLSTSRRTWR